MIPLHDPDLRLHTRPYVIYALIAVNVLVFLFQFPMSDLEEASFIWRFGLIPHELTSGEPFVTGRFDGFGEVDINSPIPTWATIFTSMFLHGGFLHVAGNLLFLWVFGDNIENRFGRWRFITFYLGAGVVAALAQVLVNTDSEVPMIGASGAVAGVLGAYWLLYPRSRIHTLIFLGWFIFHRRLPAVYLIGFWAAYQIFLGLGSLASPDVGGVAYFAHLGGLTIGVIVGASSRLRAGWHETPRQYRPRS